MAPGINQNSRQGCNLCSKQHHGRCNQEENYLLNKNFECGCNPLGEMFGKDNHYCICKWTMNYKNANWGRNGVLRCYRCMKQNKKITDLPREL